MKKCLLFAIPVFLIFNSCARDIQDKAPETPDQLSEFLSYEKEKPVIVSAHRGGPSQGFPENAAETLVKTAKNRLMMLEIDIALTKDSVLVLMHDDSLHRTTTGHGLVSEKTWQELQLLRLIDQKGDSTPFLIPRFDSILVWAKGLAVLSLDIKKSVSPDLVAQTVQKHQATGYSTFITYRMEQAQYLHSLDTSFHLSVTIRNQDEWQLFRQTGIPARKVVAFAGLEFPVQSVIDSLHSNGIAPILGTFRSADEEPDVITRKNQYLDFYKRGIAIIATDRPEEVFELFIK